MMFALPAAALAITHCAKPHRRKEVKPWLIIPIGLCFAVVCYALFRFMITKFNLLTPGRESEEDLEDVTKA